MEALGMAFGAAALVAVPLALFLGLAGRRRRRRERRVSEQRRSSDTAIDLSSGARRTSAGEGESRSPRRRRSGSSREPAIDLFAASRGKDSAGADPPAP